MGVVQAAVDPSLTQTVLAPRKLLGFTGLLLTKALIYSMANLFTAPTTCYIFSTIISSFCYSFFTHRQLRVCFPSWPIPECFYSGEFIFNEWSAQEGARSVLQFSKAGYPCSNHLLGGFFWPFPPCLFPFLLPREGWEIRIQFLFKFLLVAASWLVASLFGISGIPVKWLSLLGNNQASPSPLSSLWSVWESIQLSLSSYLYDLYINLRHLCDSFCRSSVTAFSSSDSNGPYWSLHISIRFDWSGCTLVFASPWPASKCSGLWFAPGSLGGSNPAQHDFLFRPNQAHLIEAWSDAAWPGPLLLFLLSAGLVWLMPLVADPFWLNVLSASSF